MDVKGVAVSPVADVGGGGGGGRRGTPGERDDAVAEASHGFRILAGIDGLGFRLADDVTKAHGVGVGFVKGDGRVVEEAGFEDFQLALLP